MLKVHIYPDPILGRPAGQIKRIDRQLLQLVREMFETMYAKHGVGLAAPQVGQSIRVCVLNCTGETDGELALINPLILEMTGEHTDEEGCLSIPGIRSNVTRAERVKVRAYNTKGEEFEIDADGLQSRAFQHEIDHLDGRLFLQRLSQAARMIVNSDLKALEEQFGKK